MANARVTFTLFSARSARCFVLHALHSRQGTGAQGRWETWNCQVRVSLIHFFEDHFRQKNEYAGSEDSLILHM